jgi:hypothetical protein
MGTASSWTSGSGGTGGIVTGEIQTAPGGCSPLRRNSALALGHHGVGLHHRRLDQHQPSAPTDDRGLDSQGCHGGGSQQVDGEPRGLQVGVGAVGEYGALDGVPEHAADEVSADRRSPRPLRDGGGGEVGAVAQEVRRRQLCRHRR